MKPRVLVKYQLVWIGYLVKIDIIYLVFITGTTGKILCNCFDRIISVSWGRNPTFSMQAGNARKKKPMTTMFLYLKKAMKCILLWIFLDAFFFTLRCKKHWESLYNQRGMQAIDSKKSIWKWFLFSRNECSHGFQTKKIRSYVRPVSSCFTMEIKCLANKDDRNWAQTLPKLIICDLIQFQITVAVLSHLYNVHFNTQYNFRHNYSTNF